MIVFRGRIRSLCVAAHAADGALSVILSICQGHKIRGRHAEFGMG